MLKMAEVKCKLTCVDLPENDRLTFTSVCNDVNVFNMTRSENAAKEYKKIRKRTVLYD